MSLSIDVINKSGSILKALDEIKQYTNFMKAKIFEENYRNNLNNNISTATQCVFETYCMKIFNKIESLKKSGVVVRENLFYFNIAFTEITSDKAERKVDAWKYNFQQWNTARGGLIDGKGLLLKNCRLRQKLPVYNRYDIAVPDGLVKQTLVNSRDELHIIFRSDLEYDNEPVETIKFDKTNLRTGTTGDDKMVNAIKQDLDNRSRVESVIADSVNGSNDGNVQFYMKNDYEINNVELKYFFRKNPFEIDEVDSYLKSNFGRIINGEFRNNGFSVMNSKVGYIFIPASAGAVTATTIAVKRGVEYTGLSSGLSVKDANDNALTSAPSRKY